MNTGIFLVGLFFFFTFVGILRQSRRKTGARVTAEDDSLVHVESINKKEMLSRSKLKKK